MFRSDYAIRKGIENIPGPDEIVALHVLCGKVLEPIRAIFAAPLIVSSGYRSPEVNKGIGGAGEVLSDGTYVPTSQHCKGEAADFTVHGQSNISVIKAIIAASPLIPYDQLIYEGGEAGWIHVSHSLHGEQRRQILNADFATGKAVYSPLAV
jgi:hypothetical protein